MPSNKVHGKSTEIKIRREPLGPRQKLNLSRASARGRLPEGQIHWETGVSGEAVGFRRTGDKAGTWWARKRDSDGKRRYRRLVSPDGNAWADQYDLATGEARKWYRQIDKGLSGERLTVRDACERYLTAFASSHSAASTEIARGRFERLVFGDEIASIALEKLRPPHVEGWRKRLAKRPARVSRSKEGNETKRRADSTVNRDMSGLRAALNLALEQSLIDSDMAWRTHLKPIKDADGQRDIYLDRGEREVLIASTGAEIRPFVTALCLLPLRPGAMASLTVGDFDKRRNSLSIGKDKKGRPRKIIVPDQTAKFLADQCRSKLPAAPIFSRIDGRAWDKDSWKGPIKDAVTAAELRPDASAYALRHSTITDLLTEGLPALTVAQISGTSVAMIERHYGHLLENAAVEALATLSL